MSYERLIDEHAQIDVVLERLRALVEAETPDLPAVTIALSNASSELTHHLAHEDSFIYPRMIGGESDVARDAATAFVSDFAALRDDWALYLSEWNAECIGSDWQTFRAATLTMIERLAKRVEAENTVLYAAALRESIIPLRDPQNASAD